MYNFRTIRPVGPSCSVRRDGRTDGRTDTTKLNGRFSQFCERTKKSKYGAVFLWLNHQIRKVGDESCTSWLRHWLTDFDEHLLNHFIAIRETYRLTKAKWHVVSFRVLVLRKTFRQKKPGVSSDHYMNSLLRIRSCSGRFSR